MILVLVASLSIVSRADGQWIELRPTPTRPSVPGAAPLEHSIAALRSDLDRLEMARSVATPPRSTLVDGLIAYRRLALELLEMADRDRVDADTAWLLGLRLADGAPALDQALRSLVSAAPDDPALRALGAFGERDGPLSDVVSDDDDLRAVVDRRLSALVEAVARADGVLVRPAWPRTDPDGVVRARVETGPSIDALRAILHRDPAPDAALADAIERALADLRGQRAPRDRAVLAAAESLLALDARHRTLDWLRGSDRDALVTALRTWGSELIPAKDDVGGAGRPMAVAHEARSVLALLDRLDVAHRSASGAEAVRRLADSVGAAWSSEGTSLDDRLAARRATSALLDRMERFRDLDVRVRRPELQRARTALLKSYRVSEDAAVRAAARLLEDPGLITDPALGSLLRAQARDLDDLERIARLSEWRALAADVRPERAEALEERLAAVAAQLDDPARRPDAVRILTEFERQLTRGAELEGEDDLRRGAVGLAGSAERQRAVAAAIDRARGAWFEAWADGNGSGPAAIRMLALHRLMLVLADLRAGPDAAAALNRWAPWRSTDRAIAACAVQASARIDSAVAAALNDDAEALMTEVEQLEWIAAPVRLAARLAPRIVIGLPARRERDDSLGRLLGTALAPPPDAWRGLPANQVESWCRGLETWHRLDPGPTRQETMRYVRDLARLLLADLNEPPGRPPHLSDLLPADGSDGDAGGMMMMP